MTDDIVTRLRAECDEQTFIGYADLAALLSDAADEIERLRAAGDALALSIETFAPGVLAHISINQTFREWEDARRG